MFSEWIDIVLVLFNIFSFLLSEIMEGEKERRKEQK
jgi:hypothetical protein